MVNDEQVEGVQIAPSDSDLRLVDVKPGGRSEESMLLASTLVAFAPSLLHYIASGIHDREGIAVDESGFRYPTDELDPGEEPFQGVQVFNPLGEVEVSVDAFERLMARYLRTSVDSGLRRRHAVVDAAWWAELCEMLASVEARVGD